MADERGWEAIMQEVRAQVTADLIAAEQTPLEFGAPIVFSDHRYGRTVGLSPVHHVGLTQHGETYTTCGEMIPAPLRRLPLSPALVQTMTPCKFCAAKLARLAREQAA